MRSSLLYMLIVISLLSCNGKKKARPVYLDTNYSSEKYEERSNTISPNSRETNTTDRELSGSEIFERYNSAVFMIFTSDGWSNFQGSGFFITDKGIAVSNYHVFKGTTKGLENIKLSDGTRYKVTEVIWYDEDEDYILFRVGVGDNTVNYIPLCSSVPKVGEKAYAIGSPRGLENTFSSGEVSQIRDGNILQISVPIDHGSSGGALINGFGEVIGITTAGRDDSGANLNFAMSIRVIDKHISDN